MLSSLIDHIQHQLPDTDLDTQLQNPDPNCCALELLALLPDPRKRRGIRHPLHLLLTLAAAAHIANQNTYTQMHEYAEHLWETQPRWGEKFHHGPPSADTFERIFAILNADFFDLAQSQWATDKLSRQTPPPDGQKARQQTADFRVFSVDGKESRSAKHGSGTRSHNLAAADHATGVVIAQVAVGEKSNEIPYLKNLLESIHDTSPKFLPGTVITIDALHTQQETARMIRSYGAEYVMTVKGNQPSLQTHCAALPWDKVPVSAVNEDFSHGRYVRRELKLVQPVGALKMSWPWAMQVGQLTRTAQRSVGGPMSNETVFVVTSLAPGKLTAGVLNKMLQNHWGIENKVHWVRDTAFNEDKNQVRRGNAARVMASLANLTMNILRLAGFHQVSKARRKAGREPELVSRLLLGLATPR